MPRDTEKLPLGAMRDRSTGALLTAANASTARRADLQPAPARPRTLPSTLAGVLGLLAVAAGGLVALVAALPPLGLTPPIWLASAAGVGLAVSPLLCAGAYWAAGGNPLEMLRRFAPKVPLPPELQEPSDGSSSRPSDGAAGGRGPYGPEP